MPMPLIQIERHTWSQDTERPNRPSGEVDHEYVGVRAVANCRRPEGRSLIRIEGAATLGVDKNDADAQNIAYRNCVHEMATELRLMGLNAQAVEDAVQETLLSDPERERARQTTRQQLLQDTLPNTGDVFAFIEDLSRTDACWTEYAGLGIRGSYTGKPPQVAAPVVGTGTGHRESGKRNWIDDGTLTCMCPLGIGADDGENDESGPNAHQAPFDEAHRRATETSEDPAKSQGFGMNNLSWGLLVIASDDGDAEEWLNENAMQPTADEQTTIRTTVSSIRQWLGIMLRPAAAEVAYVLQ